MVSDLVESGMAAVEEELSNVVRTDVQLLQEASQHIISAGGKRMRPRLVFLAYLAAGGQELDSIVPLAAAVELVHTATLVHDDINDHSLTRRGKIAVHAGWGRTFALLTGDYMFAKVYEMMAPYGEYYNVTMSTACVRLVEGETLQAAAAKEGTINQETYKKIIALKTASLFEAAARMGASMAKSEERTIDALGSYAHNLGLAFQIVDDVLDVVGDAEKMGKPTGSDVLQGAGAIVAQNGRKQHTQSPTNVEAETTADPIKELMARLQKTGAVELAQAQALEYAQRALSAITDLPESPAKVELLKLAELVLERQN